MSGPWDNYSGGSTAGPWTKYAPLPPPPAPSAANQPSSSVASIGRNFVAGAESGITGLGGLATKAAENFVGYNPDLMDQIAKAAGHPEFHTFDPSEYVERGLNREIGQYTGINPDDVAANTAAERIARGIGAGASSVLIPGDEAALPMALKGALSGGAGAVASEVAPEGYKEKAGLVTSLLTGFGVSGRRGLTAQEENDAATRYVAGRATSAGKTPTDLRQFAKDKFGKPVTGAEAIGPTGETALSALARRQGGTGQAATEHFTERMLDTRERMLSDFASASGIHPRAAQGDIDSLVEQGRKEAKPLYEAVRQHPGGTWNETLSTIAKRPVVRSAMQKAAEDLRNADKNPMAYGIVTDPVTGELSIQQHPTAEAWDLIKKNLGYMVERNTFGKVIPDSISRGNHNINVASRDLTSALKEAIPGYKEALDKAGDYLSLNRAFEDGNDLVTSNSVTAEEFRQHVNALSPAERRAFQGGIANKLFDKAQAGQLKPQFFDKPVIRDKIAIALGPQKAPAFLNRAKVEAEMGRSGAAIVPRAGSQTQPLKEAMTDQDAAFSANMKAPMDMLHAGYHLAHGNPVWAVRQLMTGLEKMGVFGREGTMPIAVRDEAGRILMMTPDELAHHLESAPALRTPKAAQYLRQFASRLMRGAKVAGGPTIVDLSEPTQH